MAQKKNTAGRPPKYRLDYHSPFKKIMETAAKNEITVTNDMNRPGYCSIFYHNVKGKAVRSAVEHDQVGLFIQRIIDMRYGIEII